MPYETTDNGHRIDITGNFIEHARSIYDQGLPLEALLLIHEYIEQRLNNMYWSIEGRPNRVYRKFKPQIDLLFSRHLLSHAEYQDLNQFNHLKNTIAHQMLDFSLKLKGAKKGDVERAMDLANHCNMLVDSIFTRSVKSKREKKPQSKRGKNQ
jgi:hypothetical protein